MKKLCMCTTITILIIVLSIGCENPERDNPVISDHISRVLVDNGNSTITDDDRGDGQGLMWLQEADTSGMTYEEAVNWAADLVFGGYDDWRLPSAMEFNTATPDLLWNSMSNEFGHLYGMELGNPANAADTLPFVMPPLYYWTGDMNGGVTGEAYGFFWSWDGIWLLDSYPVTLQFHVTAVREIEDVPEITPPPEVTTPPEVTSPPIITPPIATSPPAGVYPGQGTIGTIITITGSGFGPENGDHVYIDNLKCDVVTWTDSLIEAVIVQAMSPGTYDVKIVPGTGVPIVMANSFSIVPPVADINAPIESTSGAKVEIDGMYFGSRNAAFRVYIWSKETETKIGKALIDEYDFDPITGTSWCTVTVPSLPAGSYYIKACNVVACTGFYDGLTISNCGLTTIDFDELPPGTHLVGNEYSSSGIILSAHYNPDWPYDPPDMVVGYWGPAGTLAMDSYCNTDGYFQVDFSIPVNYVSVEMTTFENGNYDLGLILYDGSDTILAQDIITGVNGVTYTLKAAITCKKVAYARFYGYYGGPGGVNATRADNLVFGVACKTTP